MRAGEGLVVSGFVLFALAVVPKALAFPPHVAMPSIATSQTDPLVSALLHPRPAIALAATSRKKKKKKKFL
ncbi:hypothetical protein Sjap_009545 [Stephania japonica]|uniref:Secreted protein n=1 Tax=Stephania japonica TaxID=461633 RepID=A0AAP0JRK0_9MAGN